MAADIPRTVALSDLSRKLREGGFEVDDEQLRRVSRLAAEDLAERNIEFGDDLPGAWTPSVQKPVEEPGVGPGGHALQMPLRAVAGAGQRLLQSINAVLGEVGNLVRPLAMQETAAKLRELGVDTALLGPEDPELAEKVTGQALGELERLRGRAFFKAPQIPANLVQTLERDGILGQARMAERIAQTVGDITMFFLPISAASRSLQGARLFTGRIGQVFREGALLSTGTVLEMRQQARIAGPGADLSSDDYVKGIASSMVAVPLGMAGGKAVVRGVERLMHRPLGKAVADLVRGGALGVAFEGGGAALEAHPGGFTKEELQEIMERAIAGGIAFPLANTFTGLFDGPSRSRTQIGIDEQVRLSAEYLDAAGFGVRGARPAPKSLEALETKIQESKAQAFTESAKAPLEGKPQKLEPQDLQRMFGISEAKAKELAGKKLTKEQTTEIQEKKTLEAMLLIAEGKAPEVRNELLYRAGQMTPLEARAWEIKRAQFSQADIETIVSRLPSAAEVKQAMQNEEFRFEVEGLRLVTEAESRLLGRPLPQREGALLVGELAEAVPRVRGRPLPPAGEPIIRQGVQPKQITQFGEPAEPRRARIVGGKIVEPPREKPSGRVIIPPVPPSGGVAPPSLGGRQARIQTSRLMRPAVWTPVGETYKTEAAAKSALTKAQKAAPEKQFRVTGSGERFALERQLAPAEPVPRLADILPPPGEPPRPIEPEKPPQVPEKGPKPPEARRAPEIKKAPKVTAKAPPIAEKKQAPPRKPPEEPPAVAAKKPPPTAPPEAAAAQTIKDIDREVRGLVSKMADVLQERRVQKGRAPRKGERVKAEQFAELREVQSEIRSKHTELAQARENEAAAAAGREPRTVLAEDVFGRRVAGGGVKQQIRPLSQKQIEKNISRRERGLPPERPLAKQGSPLGPKRFMEEAAAREKMFAELGEGPIPKAEREKMFDESMRFFEDRAEEFARLQETGKNLEEKAAPLRDTLRETPHVPPVSRAIRQFPGRMTEIVDRATQMLGERATRGAFELPEGYKKARKERSPERIKKTLEAHLEGDTAALLEAEKRLRERPKLRPEDWELPVWAALVPAAGIVGLQIAGKEEEAAIVGMAAAPFLGGRRTRKIQGAVDKWVGNILDRKAGEPRPFTLETEAALKRLRKSRMGNAEIEAEIRQLDDTFSVQDGHLALRRNLKSKEIGRFARTPEGLKEARKVREEFEKKNPEALTRIIRIRDEYILREKERFLEPREHTAVGEVAPRVQMTNVLDKPYLERVFTVLGSAIARRGPASELLNVGVQRYVQNTRNILGAAMFNMRQVGNGLFHDIDPHRELSGKENRNLAAVMEDGAKPMNDKVRILAEQQRMIYRGEVTPGLDKTVMDDAVTLRRHSDAQMRYIAERAIEVDLPFVPRLNEKSGSYGPVMFREEVHPPGAEMKFLNPRGYEKAYRRSQELRERIYQRAVERNITLPNPDGEGRHVVTREEVNLHLDEHHRRGFRSSPWHANLEEVTVRRNPYLELHRLLDVDVGIEWDPARIYRRYVRSAVQRLELAQEFGPEMERARYLIREAGEQGYDERRIQDMFDAATGQSPKMSREQQIRWLNEISGVTSITALGLSNISQLTSWARTPEHTRQVDFLTGWEQTFKAEINRNQIIPRRQRQRFGDEEHARFLAESGVAVEAEFALALSELRGWTPRAAGAFLRSTGMVKLDRMGRTLAAAQARSYARWLFKEWEAANKLSDAKDIETTKKRLAELYADESPVTAGTAFRAIVKGKVQKPRGAAYDIALKLKKSPDEMRYLEGAAAARVVARAHGRTEAIDLPEMAAHPYGGHLFKLMTFSVRMTAESVRQAMQFRQLPREQQMSRVAAAAGAMGVSYMLQRARLAVMGRDPRERDAFNQFVNLLSYYGFMSSYIEVARTLTGKYGPRTRSYQERVLRGAMGPTYETAFEAIWDAGYPSIRDWSGDPLNLFLLGRTPQPWRDRVFGEKIQELKSSVESMAKEEQFGDGGATTQKRAVPEIRRRRR